MKYANLFKSGFIGKVEMKNRLVMAPMGTPALTGFKGTFSDRLMDYYERRAIGGIGLIITGVSLINSKVEPWEASGEPSLVTFDELWKVQKFHSIDRENSRPRDQSLRAIDRRLWAGLAQKNPRSSRYAGPGAVAGGLPWRPEIMAREITLEEIETLIKSFGRASLVAR